MIVESNAVFHKNPLHKSASRCNRQAFFFLSIIRKLCKNMSFIVRMIIVAVNDPYRIAEDGI